MSSLIYNLCRINFTNWRIFYRICCNFFFDLQSLEVLLLVEATILCFLLIFGYNDQWFITLQSQLEIIYYDCNYVLVSLSVKFQKMQLTPSPYEIWGRWGLNEETTILDKKSWNTWCQRSLINLLSPLPHYNVGLNSNGKQTTLHGVGGGGDVNL